MAVVRTSPGNAPQPRGPYSMVSVASRGAQFAHLSGQTGRRSDGTIADGAEQQTVDAFGNIGMLVTSIGATPFDILHLRSYIVGRDSLDAFNASRDSVFAGWFGMSAPPSHTLVFVVGLADPQAVVEIEAVVEVPVTTHAAAFDTGRHGK